MQKNPKLVVIIAVICSLLIAAIFWTSREKPQRNASGTITTQQLKQDTASGDNENEVLRTVLANQESLKEQNKKLKETNDQLRQKGIVDLKNMIASSKQSIQDEMSNLKSSFESQLKSQQQKIGDIAQSGGGKGSFQINGAWSGDQIDGKAHVITSVPDLSASFAGNVSTKADQVSSQLEENNAPSLPSDSQDAGNAKNKDIKPFYTIPANSTLNHVKLMTSIIAEVPVSGRLLAPAFPFKAIIGRRELYAANGMSIPDDLAGTVVQGYSVGNMTLSCARIYVTRLLFVFNDGHFVVYPAKSDNESATSLYPKDALGYLSDSYGNTCLTGKYITDAPKVIANFALLGGIKAGADAVAASQFTTMNNGQSFTSQLTGSVPKLVGASAIGGGSQQVLTWYQDRVNGIFDAVYIPASFRGRPTNLVLNITKTIPIDLNKKGRTLRYEDQNALSSYFKRLD